MNSLLVLLAILPGILICVYLYYLDKYEKESKLHLFICFLLGVAITYPAIKIEAFIETNTYDYSLNIFTTLLFSFGAVALVEEVLKFIALLIYPYPRSFFNEPMDGIIYAVMIGMGFATLENVLYALDYGLETTILRAFTAVPAHGIFAVFMGYYLGLAKFAIKEKRSMLFVASLGMAVLVHGIYDFFILQQVQEWLMLLAIVTLFVSAFFSWKFIVIHQEASPFKVDKAIAEGELDQDMEL